MAQKSEFDVALEMYQSVMQSPNKQKRLKSSTFWRLFNVKSRRSVVIERIGLIIENQGLKLTVKSGAPFGLEDYSDWIILTKKLLPPEEPLITSTPSNVPSPGWFEMMQTRSFESEREVESYFITPLLEELGYEYDDIVIGFPVKMFKGVQKINTEADIVAFNGLSRKKHNVLLVVEAKHNDKGISGDQIGQAKSYAQELLPACYIVSNGQKIMVFQFNGMLIPNECVMDFNRSELPEKWAALYSFVSKKATIQRKQWMSQLTKENTGG